MSKKMIIEQFAEEIKKAAENEDLVTARNQVRRVADKWMHEADQMLEDKESRVIYVASVIAAILFGIMIGLFL